MTPCPEALLNARLDMHDVRMTVIEGRTWLEWLSPPACRRHLNQNTIGRVALIVEGHPEVFPVNYAIDGDDIVFRTDPGTKLSAVAQQPTVAFEIDDVDFENQGGWSVQVIGTAKRVSDAAELRRLRDEMHLEPWLHGEKSNWVRIKPLTLSGRRIHHDHRVKLPR